MADAVKGEVQSSGDRLMGSELWHNFLSVLDELKKGANFSPTPAKTQVLRTGSAMYNMHRELQNWKVDGLTQ
ncbi:MAG: hypothetical protein D3924_05295 [Candidatus Electrothrix sp. AR4]|nr:hypothetical protein [Candidatus Electrothrix sp. AR4]